MKFKNYTPHPINVLASPAQLFGGPEHDAKGDLRPMSFPSEGVARVEVVERPLAHSLGGVTIYRQDFGEVTGLPDPAEGVYIIVSAMVKSALPARRDLVSPCGLVRDDQGRVVGCKGFAL